MGVTMNAPLVSTCIPAALPGTLQAALARRGTCQLEGPIEGPGSKAKQDRQLETALMELFRDEGSQAAFQALYARAAPGLVRWVLHCMKGHCPVADPMEVAQDAWCGIVRYVHSFNRGSRKGHFQAWARTIAINALRQRVRWIQRMETCDHRLLVHERDGARGPRGMAQDREESLSLQQALLVLLVHLGAAYEGLAPRDKRILDLLEIQGCAREEVAKEMGVGRSGVKMILFRARKRLALALARSLGLESVQAASPPARARAVG